MRGELGNPGNLYENSELPELDYFNHEEYKVREISKNEITGRYDLWLDPNRTGNHQIPIVVFRVR